MRGRCSPLSLLKLKMREERECEAGKVEVKLAVGREEEVVVVVVQGKVK